MKPASHHPQYAAGAPYVSTGQLPPQEHVQMLVEEAHARFKTDDAGHNADYYPALAQVPRDLFGICVVGVNGVVCVAGDVSYEFTIMSVSKPFTFALVCQAIGVQAAREKLGVNATGLPFNSIVAIEQGTRHLTNPMVNPGAIAAVSLIPGDTGEEKWQSLHDGLSRFAGRTLSLNEEVYASATASNFRNQAITRILYDYQRLYFDPAATLDLYTRACSLNVTARDLAIMAATLADGGVNPLTRARVIDAPICQTVLAVMATAGLYETSGDWLLDIGLPGKSGVGGGVIVSSPGKGGMGVFAPPLDEAGNSVKGQRVARFLSQALGLNIFASAPAELG
jgi:glutaminase